LKKSTTYIIVAVLVIVIIVAGAAAYYLSQNGGGTTSPTATPTPTPNPVDTANSLGFVVNATEGQTSTILTFAGIDLQSVNRTIRIDIPANGLSYVLKYGTMQSYSSVDNGTTWTLSSDFAADAGIWGARWDGTVHSLSAWDGTGTTFSYVDSTTTPVTNVLVSGISINPELPASIFDTPTG
jgi:hypothetical protein